MTDRSPNNIVASIHQRLLNASKQTNRPFNDLVTYYAIERFLYRLSQSRYADRIILKGGLMLQVWNAPVTRITRDIDLLGKFNNDLDQVKKTVGVVCDIEVENDGLVFDPKTVETSRIAEDADYKGVRVTFRGRFGKMPLAMQIDFGFSDVVTPEPAHINYPSLLDHPQAKLLAYNRETVLAEKFEAMVKLGELNSRMKDFFDVWALAGNFYFNGRILADAIRSTFMQRETNIEADPACFSDRFAQAPAKSAQWVGFIRNSRIEVAPAEFAEVLAYVRDFLQPVADSLSAQRTFDKIWSEGGPWR